VVLGAVHPRVVRALVIVPYGDEGVLAMHRLQIGVFAIVCVAPSIVVEAHDLVRRIVRTRGAVRARRIFVNVVAEVQDGVEIEALSDAAVSVEIAVRVARARHHREAKAIHAAVRRGARAAHRRRAIESDESIVVRGRRREPGNVDLDGVVAILVGPEFAALYDVGKRDVSRDLPFHVDPVRARIGHDDVRPLR
jgi:hypothetical protein